MKPKIKLIGFCCIGVVLLIALIVSCKQPSKPPPPPPDGMELILGGEFDMGSNDPEAKSNEKPVHRVYVDTFYMDKTEVTKAQFKEFIKDYFQLKNPHLLENPRWKKWKNYDYPPGKANHPVVNVNWDAAHRYAKWAGKRLPTEAEWEYAARGGLIGNKYPNGNTITDQDANFNHNNRDIFFMDPRKATTPVGKYPENGYGLHDMAGNVKEWCQDGYDSKFYSKFPQNEVARNPLSHYKGYGRVNSRRVLRGGSFYDKPAGVRVSARFANSSDKPYDSENIGFRCVKDITP